MIQEKDLAKLKQLDRIEYILKKNLINEKYGSSYVYAIVKAFFLIFTLVFLFMILFTLVYGIHFFRLFSYFVVILSKLFILLIIVGYIADVFNVVQYHKEIKELNLEYFNFKTELKKNKR